MIKPSSKVNRFPNKLKSLVLCWLAVLVLCVGGLAAFTDSTAYAANFYQNKKGGKCNDADLPLDPGKTHDGQTYYCVGALKPAEVKPGETCDEGTGGVVIFGTKGCLINPIPGATYDKGCPAGVNSKGGCNIVGKNAQACGSGEDLCGIFDKFVNPIINFLSIGVGIIVIAMIILGGVQYSSSGGDPQKAAAAKARISNAVFALIIYAVLFAFLQWVVPGGLI